MNIFTIILIQPLANGLILFYKLFGGNLGLAIMGFSLFLIFLMRPLTKPYMESMKKIRDLQPLINKLKKKYGKDQVGFSKAQAELYKQKGVNPAAGCLPYILQIIVLIALFKVFTTVLGTDGSVISKVNELMYPPLRFSQEAALNTKFFYLDIAKPDTFRIPGIPFSLPGLFLILAAAAQFLSVKITTPYIEAEKKVAQKTKDSTDDMQVAMQSSMTYTFPLMTLIFGLTLPSGLALYWLIFSIVNVWQQVASNGWGSITPFIARLGLLQSTTNAKRENT